jgi:DNA-binding PadR family transcriptional regulator
MYSEEIVMKAKEAEPEADLGRNEELLLLSIWRLGENAYGVTLREAYREATGKELNFGSLYNTLYRLVRKGLARSRESGPESRKGGRRKILYAITPDGKRALHDALEARRRAWDGIPGLAAEEKP